MSLDLILKGSVGLLPVVCFLGALLWFDSYKLVFPRVVVTIILFGALAAGVSYFINGAVLRSTDIEFHTYSRYIAPLVEELLKGSILIYLIRKNRIGFLVDAGIFGFAVGAGFAMIENLYYLRILPDAHLGVWIVRGFGTAIMHGGVTAIFAIMAQSISEGRRVARLGDFGPGFMIAVLTHSLFNHYFLSPVLSTLAIIVVMPLLASFVIRQSERSVEAWLDVGFDADTELLDLINSGRFSESNVGLYLNDLKERFQGPIVADLLCYLRIHVELALRAKGELMMRDAGFKTELDPETRAKLVELEHLEKSIGKTGKLAIHPFLHMSRKDLWQLYVLGR